MILNLADPSPAPTLKISRTACIEETATPGAYFKQIIQPGGIIEQYTVLLAPISDPPTFLYDVINTSGNDYHGGGQLSEPQPSPGQSTGPEAIHNSVMQPSGDVNLRMPST